MRLTAEQDDAIQGRARRRHATDSEALRELIDLGRILDAGEAAGVVVTREALKLMRDPVGANLQFGAGLREDRRDVATDVLRLADDQVDALDRGALLICTTEQMDALA